MDKNSPTVDELVELILSPERTTVSKKTDEYKQLIEATSFLDLKSRPKERALHYKFKIFESAKCPACGAESVVDRGALSDKFHAKACSAKCRSTIRNKTKSLKDSTKQYKRRHKTLSKIDPETGLTGYQKAGRKAQATLSKVNPETGLTRAQEVGLKAKDTLSKIDPETGLSGHKKAAVKAKATLSKVDPETGLTGYQLTGIKAKDTLSKIDPETGLSGYQKITQTLSKVDPETGLTGYQSNSVKIKQLLSKIDPETGLTGYQKAGAKAKDTLSKIKPETGLTGYEQIGKKRSSVTYKRIVEHNAAFTILTTVDDFASNKQTRNVEYECNECGSVRTSAYAYIRCLECNPYTSSIPEKEVFEFCRQFTNDLIMNDRSVITPLELDIYSDEYKLAIEFDGLYWHSSDSVINEKKNYHLEKTDLCKETGVHLLHVFENEWAIPEKQLIWKSIIRNKFGRSKRMFARKCVIKPVDSRTTRMFLDNNHLQGSCPSSINYGLYYEEKLVSLMTFGKSRYDRKIDFELIRFCSIVDTSVTGGASRLFNHFIKNHKGSVISYADKRRSNGNLYHKLGFELSHETKPNYFYVVPGDKMVLHSRVKFQKHKLPGLLEVFDKSKTESENMYNNGYRKIYDCGNYVFIYKEKQ